MGSKCMGHRWILSPHQNSKVMWCEYRWMLWMDQSNMIYFPPSWRSHAAKPIVMFTNPFSLLSYLPSYLLTHAPFCPIIDRLHLHLAKPIPLRGAYGILL